MADAPRGFGEQFFQRLQGKGLSRAQIYKALAVQRLTEEVVSLGADGKLDEAQLVEISKISSAARQKQLAEVTVGCNLDVSWVKELARLIRNAEKTSSDKEANRYWDFFFELKDILERDGASEDLLKRLRTFSVDRAGTQDAADRSVVEFRKYELLQGRGLDVGTSNIVASARTTDDKTLFNIQRNAFIDVRNDTYVKKMLMKLGIDHIVQGDKGYVIGDPAFDLANIFEKNTRRPMKDGMISPQEKEALTIVGLIIAQLLGPPRAEGEICSFSVPADPIDVERNVVYHRGSLEYVLRKLGYEPRAMVEGHCVVMGEMEKDEFTGVGISCGAGMFNICIGYKSVPALSFSTSRGGDWIDNNVSAALGLPSSQVCAVKESGVDLMRPRDRVEDAIVIYYRELIRYSLDSIRTQFGNSQTMPNFAEPVPLVCAGGTSMVKGFIEIFKQEFARTPFPIEIKEIRLAHDPLRTVARGCLVDAMEETKARARVAQVESIPLGRAAVSKVTQLGKAAREMMKPDAPPPVSIPRSEPIKVESRRGRPGPPPRPEPAVEPEPARAEAARLLPGVVPMGPGSVPQPEPSKVEPMRPFPERRKEQQAVVRPAMKLPPPQPAPAPPPPPPPRAEREETKLPDFLDDDEEIEDLDTLEIAEFGAQPGTGETAPLPEDADTEPPVPPVPPEDDDDFPLIS